MEWLATLQRDAAGFLDTHSLLAACLLLFVEEAGVPIPIPGDFAMVLIGAQARAGRLALWQAILALETATVFGGGVLYAASRWAGRPLVLRYGRVLRLTPERLLQAERRIERHGVLAVAVARLVPGLRIVSVIACGLFGVPVRVFVPGLVAGSLVYTTAYTLLGFFVGPAILTTLESAGLPFAALGSLILLVGVLVWLIRARRALRREAARVADALESTGAVMSGPPLTAEAQSQRRAGAAAGAVATLVSALAMNVLSQFAGVLAAESPAALVGRTELRLTQLAPDWPLFFLAAPILVAIGVGWGSLYGLVHHRVGGTALPDWLRGPLFAVGPLAIWMLIGAPLLEQHPYESHVSPGAAPGEAVRYLAYGLTLGAAYPVFAARLRRRPSGRRP